MVHKYDKYHDEFGEKIICVNCDISARDYFENYKSEHVPIYFYNGMNWYCSEQCYDESTRDEG